jgi:hypothetical protein
MARSRFRAPRFSSIAAGPRVAPIRPIPTIPTIPTRRTISPTPTVQSSRHPREIFRCRTTRPTLAEVRPVVPPEVGPAALRAEAVQRESGPRPAHWLEALLLETVRAEEVRAESGPRPALWLEALLLETVRAGAVRAESGPRRAHWLEALLLETLRAEEVRAESGSRPALWLEALRPMAVQRETLRPERGPLRALWLRALREAPAVPRARRLVKSRAVSLAVRPAVSPTIRGWSRGLWMIRPTNSDQSPTKTSGLPSII